MSDASPSSNQRVFGSICDPPCVFYEAKSCMCAHLEAGGYVKHFGDPATKRKTIPCEKHWAGNPGPSCCPWCEIERLRADAERYRWLSDHPSSIWEVVYLKPFRFVCKVPFDNLDAIPPTLDAAIDQAMRREREAAPADRDDRRAAMTRGPVTQEWTHALPFMQQTVLVLAMRGPDGISKYGAAKMLLRWYRRCIIKAAFVGAALPDPITPSGGSFDGPSLEGEDELDPWTDRMMVHVNAYLQQLDGVPHHFHMHLMHGIEILGYKHPDDVVRHWWHCLYLRLANDMHLHPETEDELDHRLSDTREGWLHRADPATVA